MARATRSAHAKRRKRFSAGFYCDLPREKSREPSVGDAERVSAREPSFGQFLACSASHNLKSVNVDRDLGVRPSWPETAWLGDSWQGARNP